MNWEAVGALSELAGAVGVVLTLVYLSTQIRQTNRLVSSSVSAATREARDEFVRVVATDVDANRILRLGMSDPDELSEDEVGRLFAMFGLALSAQQQEFELSGTIGPQWQSVYSSRGFKGWWKQYEEGYPRDFRDCPQRYSIFGSLWAAFAIS